MKTINHTDFMKKIFKKGKFKQYVVTPYASEENHYRHVLLLSDKVSEPTYHLYRRKKSSLILPYGNNLHDLVVKYSDDIIKHTGVHATFFGVFDLMTMNLIKTVSIEN